MGNTWETTYCIYTSRASREVLTIILFVLYIVIGCGEIAWCIHNVRNWRKCFRLVEYLPLDSDLNGKIKSDPGSKMLFGVSDLHLLMALVEVNEGSRDVSLFWLFHFIQIVTLFYHRNCLSQWKCWNVYQIKVHWKKTDFCQSFWKFLFGAQRMKVATTWWKVWWSLKTSQNN